jgi:hypothetical protein
MAGASLLTLIDDIAALLDDVSVMTKIAAKKTAGVLGDDLALNAQQVTGVKADRELPVVWAVAKGSLVNKVILVPAALLLSLFLPWTITPLLMLGGAFLCFEGFEKIAHRFLHSADENTQQHAELLEAASKSAEEVLSFERDKIKGAIKTDFVLSAEIVVITLGTVATATLANKIGVLVAISLVMTVGVYGLVAGIVKLDDLGLYLQQRPGALARRLGAGLLAFCPWLMKALSVVGTLAMFLVGGGILVHGIPLLGQWLHGLEHSAEGLPTVGHFIASLTPTLVNGLAGLVAGGLLVGLYLLAKRVLGKH